MPKDDASRMTPTNDAPVTVEQGAKALFEHDMRERGVSSLWSDLDEEDRAGWRKSVAIVLSAALASASAGDGVEAELRGALVVAKRAIIQAAKDTLWCDDSPAETVVDRIDAALARPHSAVAPAGDRKWRSVPIDPTPAMIQAGLKVDHEHLSKHGQASPLTPVWFAMVAAAPASLTSAPAGDGVEAATRMMRDCADDLVSTASHHGQYAAIDQDKIDGLRDAVRDFDAALARPRAAVGEREAAFDPVAYGARVLATMGDQSCRPVAAAIGISPATLNRVTRGGMPDVPTLYAIDHWLALQSREGGGVSARRARFAGQ